MNLMEKYRRKFEIGEGSRKQEGQISTEGKTSPIGKVAYRVYSEILQAHLWVVDTDEDMHSLTASQGVSEAIYTAGEIKKLKCLSKDSLREIHKVKEVFPESKIEEIKKHQ